MDDYGFIVNKHRSCFKQLLFMVAAALFIIMTGCRGSGNHESNSGHDRPNVIIFLADDLGYGDLNSYGGIAHTPNLDKLGENGLRFTNFYAPAPNCSPSRAGLLTGRNPNRVGIYSYRPPNSSMHLKAAEITMAELLKEKGYQTAMFGKWHLGDLLPAEGRPKQPDPSDQGFDYWLATENNAEPSHRNPVNFVRNGTPEDTLSGYSSHILAREANSWLDQVNSDKPFFLYIPFHEVHKKIASPDSLVQKYQGREDPEYRANIENLDAAVGKVIDKLREMSRFKNSLILFASDNGSYRFGSNGNLRGYKGESFEGGVRVPGILHWAEKIESGRTVTAPASMIDIYPTIADITGSRLAAERVLDGVSLAPLLNGQEWKREKPILWFFYRAYPELGMRDGDYVLNASTRDTVPRTHYFTSRDMSFIKDARLKEFKLYNIREDPLQKHDLSGDKPMVLDSLKSKAKKIFDEVVKGGPFWKNLPEYNRRHARPKRNFMRNEKRRWDMN